MIFSTAIDRVCNRLNKNSTDTTVRARIGNHINDAMQEKWHQYAWSFRWAEYPLTLSPQVSGSTLTATNGSQTVTASNTPFLSVHLNQWLQFTGDATQSWYRILKVVSTSQVTIEPAYQGTTGSAKLFLLCTTDYDLPTDLSDLGRVKITIDSRPLPIQHQLQQDGYYQPPLSTGVPYGVSLFKEDWTKTTYTTGTVSGTSGTNTLTGSGTGWLTGILPGDEISGITGDGNTYKVQSVQSDTSLTLYNFLSTSPSGASYTAARQFQAIVRFQPCPDKSYVCFVKGLRRYNDMINPSDTNELLLRFPFAVIESAVWREASSSPDSREDALYMKSEQMWQEAMAQDTEILPQTNWQPIWNPRQNYR